MKSNLESTANLDNRRIHIEWDEEAYLAKNPDVAKAVESGVVSDGAEHFVSNGRTEGRLPAFRRHYSHSNPSIEKFDAFYYYLKNPDVAEAAEEEPGFDPAGHFAQYGASENRLTAENYYETHPAIESFPSWLKKDLRDQFFHEPQLLKILNHDAIPVFRQDQKSDFSGKFTGLLQRLKQAGATHLILVPWLKRGGADLEALHHCRAIAESPGNRLVVIATEPVESEWAHLLPDSALFINLPEYLPDRAIDVRMRFLERLLLTHRFKIVHVINSHLAWAILKTRGSLLSRFQRVAISLFCYDHSNAGEPLGYARFSRWVLQHADLVFTDSSYFREHLLEQTGLEPEKFCHLRYPVAHSEAFRIDVGPTSRVLWASRLDRQKQPELLIEIARSRPNYLFEVWGAAVLDTKDIIPEFQDCPNIIYQGPYDGFHQLPRDGYSCFLYTSLWDGMPNIILEAAESSIPIVSPPVGELARFLGGGRGVLVDEPDDPEAYCRGLDTIYQDAEGARAHAEQTNEFLLENHRQDLFRQKLADLQYL